MRVGAPDQSDTPTQGVMPTLSRTRQRPLSPRLIGFTEIAWSALLFVVLLVP